jgi:formylglycine-generating enzyme required for sulfatase activity
VRLGSQTRDPAAPNHFAAEASDCPEHVPAWCFTLDVRLTPYFLARHELTQGQWQRLAGTRPSTRWAGMSNIGKRRIDRTHPVETVTWEETQRALRLHGLSLPTEAQLECAERTGTQTKYGTGATLDSVLPFALCRKQSNTSPWAYHAPVDALAPNAWGFQGLYGNVAEWCLDSYSARCEGGEALEGSGEIVPPLATGRTYVPGSAEREACYLAASARSGLNPWQADIDLGLRAARTLEP